MNTKPVVSGFTGYGGKYYRTICLNPDERDERKRFTFGEDKARMIIAHLDVIKAFAGGNAIAPLPAAQAAPAIAPVPPQPKPTPTPKPQPRPSKTNWAALLNAN